MCCWDTIEFPQVALGLVPEILDAIDVVVTVGEELRMVDPEVVEVRHVPSSAITLADLKEKDIILDEFVAVTDKLDSALLRLNQAL